MFTKKNIMRCFAALFAVAICISLCSCGTDFYLNAAGVPDLARAGVYNESIPTAAAQISSPELDDGFLDIAVVEDYIPYSYVDDEGNASGFDAELARMIADKLGVALRLVPMTLDEIDNAVIEGRVDAAIPGISSSENNPQISFSYTYNIVFKNIVVCNYVNSVKKLMDLNGRDIGVPAGSTNESVVMNTLPKARVIAYDNPQDAIDAVSNGEINAAVVDSYSAALLIKNNGMVKAIGGDFFQPEYFSIAVNSNDSDLLDKINAAIEKLINENAISDLIDTTLK